MKKWGLLFFLICLFLVIAIARGGSGVLSGVSGNSAIQSFLDKVQGSLGGSKGPAVSGSKKASTENREIVVYSSRKEILCKKIFEAFTEDTGIKVKFVTDDPVQLINRMVIEKKSPKADVFFTADVSNLISAKKSGLLDKVSSRSLARLIPDKFRDEDSQWFGFSKRARVLVYNKARVKAGDISTYESLGDAKWSGRVLVRSSSSPYNQSLLAFMLHNIGHDRVLKWVRNLVKNMARKPSGGDIDQIYAVAAGEGDVAIVNSYYFGRIVASSSEKDKKVAKALALFFPNQETTGTMVNVSGAGLVKGASHKSDAVRFMEFLATEKVQSIYTDFNQEYPVVSGMHVSDVLQGFGPFRESSMKLSELDKYLDEAVKVADEGGWR